MAVIEVFGGMFVLSIGCLIFCWYRGFRHSIDSDLVLCLFWEKIRYLTPKSMTANLVNANYHNFLPWKILMLSKCYESTEVYRRTGIHVPSGTLWSNSSDTLQEVEIWKDTSTKMYPQNSY